MKWQYLLVGLFLLGCVASVGAITENFQSWGSNTIVPSTGSITLINGTTGEVSLSLPSGRYDVNAQPFIFSYAAFDGFGTADMVIYLLDANKNVIATIGTTSPTYCVGRNEINMVGMQPKYYCNGIIRSTGSVLAVNPSYLEYGNTVGTTAYQDNVVIGGSDPHVVGALPSNWTIQRDLINPAATGVYAWNNATQAWVLQNSNSFYIDADTSSQQTATTENFDILNYQTGLIVNTTVIQDQTSPYNQLQFNINTFLNTITNLGSQLPDGEYTAEFRGYPTSASYFWVISSGAVVSWDQTSYPQNAQATLTYTISPSYYQTSTYTYSLAVVSTTGQTLQTYTLNSATGTETLSLNSATFPPGAYYAEILATPVGGGTAQIMNYAAAQVTSYVYISGYVLDAETASPLTNANVTITQTGTSASALTGANGAYTISNGWLTGSTISMQTNLSGYTTDINSFIPLGAGNLNITIPLLSTTPTHTGASIGGIVRDTQYGNPVTSATVNVYNTSTSESYNNVTNIAGYYLVNNLVGNRLYDVSSSKTGYGNSTVYPVVAVAV